MNEALPDPSLPIFGEETVSYTITPPYGSRDDTEREIIEVAVDEIDTLESAKLRQALWSQFRARQTTSTPLLVPYVSSEGERTLGVTATRQSPRRIIVNVDGATGGVSHYAVPTSAIGEIFTEDGPINYDDYPAYLEQKYPKETPKEKSASFISRLLRRKR